jgi:hypothetical protein
VDAVGIAFWYKKTDEAVVHRMKTEMDYRGKEFFIHNSAIIIFLVIMGPTDFVQFFI